MAEAVAAPAAEAQPAATPAATPAAAPAPVGNIVGDAAPAEAAQSAAPVLAVAAVDPAVARTYLTDHGMKAEDAAKIPDAELAKAYDAAKAIEAAKPIEYKDFVLPEGATLDAKTLADAKALFAESKLPQDQAQKFIDYHVSAVKAAHEGNIAAFEKLQTGWRDEIMADPQIGGAKFETHTLPALSKFITSFCPDAASQKAFKEAVNMTGVGNNPHFVRALARAGAALMEGQPAAGGKPAKPTQRDFDAMASNMYPQQGQSK